MRAARLLGLAEAMGLLGSTQSVDRLDWETLRGSVGEVVARGIGRSAAVALDGARDPERIAGLLDRLYDELLQSPSPEPEAQRLLALFGVDQLAGLVGASASSLRRYAAGERTPPDALAARLHHLAIITSHLAGGYNEFGIRRWFERPRAQLRGRAPAAMLRGEWDADSQPAQRVLQLAEALNSAPAT